MRLLLICYGIVLGVAFASSMLTIATIYLMGKL